METSFNSGKRSFKRGSIRTKLQGLIVVLILLTTIFISIAAIRSIKQNYEAINQSLETALIDRYRDSTRDQVDSIVSLIEAYINQTKQQGLPISVRDERIKNAVRNTHYDNGVGYFFLYDMDGKVIAHGTDPMLEGKNLIEMKDPTGMPVIKMLRDAATSGSGYVSYLWNKPTDLIGRYKKISYAKTINNTSWWIGTGLYMDDVDRLINHVKSQQEKSLDMLFVKFMLLTATLLFFALFISIYFGGRLAHPIISLSKIAKKISSGDYKTRADIDRDDEIGDMAKSFNDMAENINQKIKDLTFKEHYTSNLIESMADGILVTNEKNVIIQINHALEKIFGYSKDELSNKNADILVSKELREKYKNEVITPALAGNTIESYTITGYKKDGTELSLMVTVSPVLEDNIIHYLIYSIKDITEQAKLRSEVKQMENLKKYFPMQVVEKLIEGNGKVNLDFNRKKVTIFFSDLVGFTELSDSMEAEEVIAILNEYLNVMSRIVYRYSGTFDKFIGDAIMVFFGAPSSDGIQQDAINCISMALDMQDELAKLNSKWKLAKPILARIGVNTGYVTVGNFGSDIRLEYTIIGTPVNIASRLEHACRPGSILISHETAQLIAEHFNIQEVDPMNLKGIHRLVNVYEVSGKK